MSAVRLEEQRNRAEKAKLREASELDSTITSAEEPKANGLVKVVKTKTPNPSAYASLCAHIVNLTYEVGFEPEKEIMRIPTTRNVGILGRRRRRRSFDAAATATAAAGVVVEASAGRKGEEGEEGKEAERSREQPKDSVEDAEKKLATLTSLIEKYMGKPIEDVGRDWRARAEGMLESRGRNH